MAREALFVPAVIDVEASGFGRGSYPIEVGVALPDGRTACFLIRPAEPWTHWDPAGEAVHGISREILLRHGKPVHHVARELNELLADGTVYSDGWGHDSGWIARLFDQAGLPQRFRVAQLQGLFGEAHYELWHATYEEVARTLDFRRHRASSDAYLIQQTYIKATLRAQSGGSGV